MVVMVNLWEAMLYRNTMMEWNQLYGRGMGTAPTAPALLELQIWESWNNILSLTSMI